MISKENFCGLLSNLDRILSQFLSRFFCKEITDIGIVFIPYSSPWSLQVLEATLSGLFVPKRYHSFLKIESIPYCDDSDIPSAATHYPESTLPIFGVNLSLHCFEELQIQGIGLGPSGDLRFPCRDILMKY